MKKDVLSDTKIKKSNNIMVKKFKSKIGVKYKIDKYSKQS